MVGGLLSLVWCLTALGLSMAIIVPKTSMYSEIDFASKLTGTEGYTVSRDSRSSLPNVVSLLSNSNSREIRKGLADSRFYVPVPHSEIEGEGNRPVTLISEGNGVSLSHSDDGDDFWTDSRRETMYQRYSRTPHGYI